MGMQGCMVTDLHMPTPYLLGAVRQVLIHTVVAGVELSAGEPSHIPMFKPALRNTVKVSEPFQSGSRRRSPELVRLLHALLVHFLSGGNMSRGKSYPQACCCGACFLRVRTNANKNSIRRTNFKRQTLTYSESRRFFTLAEMLKNLSP